MLQAGVLERNKNERCPEVVRIGQVV